jgi:hypothetical protein
MLDRHSAHRIEAGNAPEERREIFAGMAQGPDRLGEDVEGEFITRVRERRVAVSL